MSALRIVPSPEDSSGGNQRSLEVILAEIRQEHEAVVTTFRKGLQHAKRVGELLNEAKAQVDHGDWTEWVKQNCLFSKRTAENYQRIAKHWSEIEAKSQSIVDFDSDLTINRALDLIATPKQDESATNVAADPAIVEPPNAGGAVTSAPSDHAAADDAEDSDGDDEDGAEQAGDWEIAMSQEEADLGGTIEEALSKLDDSLTKLISQHDLWDFWEAEYDIELADRLVKLARQATQAAEALSMVAHSSCQQQANA